MTVRWLLNIMAPSGERSRLTVFMYHRVPMEPDALFPTQTCAAQFEQQMQWVKTWFNVLPLSEAVERLKSGSLPARPAAITFDDGYADNYTVALPILKRLGISATVFVATSFLDGGEMWNDTVIDAVRNAREPILQLPRLEEPALPVHSTMEKRAAITRLLGKLKYLGHEERVDMANYVKTCSGTSSRGDLMLTSNQLRELHRSGITIGAHTVSHPILARVDDNRAEQEIADSRDRLFALIGERPTLFAYPNGKPNQDYLGRHVAMAKRCGFVAAVSTSPGAASKGDDMFQLPRFTPWDRSALRWAWRLTRNLQLGAPMLAQT